MFSITADGVFINEDDLVYDLGGDAWRVGPLWLEHTEVGCMMAERKSINLMYSTRLRALTVALDRANRNLFTASNAQAVAIEERTRAYERLQAKKDAEIEAVNQAAAL